MKIKTFFENITIVIPIIKAIKAIIEYNRNAPEIIKAVKDLHDAVDALRSYDNEVEDFKRMMSDD